MQTRISPPAVARTVLFALAAASCARTDPSAAAPAVPTVSVAPVVPAAPLLEGIIISRASAYGVSTASGAAVDSTPAMFVHGGAECRSKAQFYIAGSTRVTRVWDDGASEPADTSALVVGAHVVVWGSGVVEGSCLRLTAASAVEIRLE
jgi:hypothetical protein